MLSIQAHTSKTLQATLRRLQDGCSSYDYARGMDLCSVCSASNVVGPTSQNQIPAGRFHPDSLNGISVSQRCACCSFLSKVFAAVASKSWPGYTAEAWPAYVEIERPDGENIQWRFLTRHGESSPMYTLYRPIVGIDMLRSEKLPPRNIFEHEASTSLDRVLDSIVPQGLPEASFLGQNTFSFLFLEMKLEACLSSHQNCWPTTADSLFLPTRLLKISTEDQDLKLSESEGDNIPPGSRYVALSHCWGGHQPIRSLTTNLASHRSHIPHSSLPPLFRDAVRVASRFKVEYLWIDSLCILQDDVEDWAREAQVMDKVYETALFTIVAADSPSSLAPFLHPLTDDNLYSGPRPMAEISFGDANDKIRIRRLDPDPSDQACPLDHRAWTFQESLLSNRIMRFTSYEAKWRCIEDQDCQCGLPSSPIQYREFRKHLGESPDSILDHWLDLLEPYGERDLTRYGDKLPALSGTASRIAATTGWRYFAGIWDYQLERQLGWRVDEDFGLERLVPNTDHTPLPSWSWASVRTPTCWDTKDNWKALARSSAISVAAIRVQPATINPYGSVEAESHLHLRAKVIDAKVTYFYNYESGQSWQASVEAVGENKAILTPRANPPDRIGSESSEAWSERHEGSDLEGYLDEIDGNPVDLTTYQIKQMRGGITHHFIPDCILAPGDVGQDTPSGLLPFARRAMTSEQLDFETRGQQKNAWTGRASLMLLHKKDAGVGGQEHEMMSALVLGGPLAHQGRYERLGIVLWHDLGNSSWRRVFDVPVSDVYLY